MSKFVLPLCLTILTAFFITWYGFIVKKFESIFITSLFNVISFSLVCIFAYFYEGSQCVSKVPETFKLWYAIPYVLSIGFAHVCWFLISKGQGAIYAAVFESIYPFFMIFIALLWGSGYKFDMNFFIGAILVCSGMVLIQLKK